MPSLARRLSAVALIVGLLGGLDGCLHGESSTLQLDSITSEVETDGVGTVTSITDGDTLRLEVDGAELRVRLIGIDTPEVYPDVECFGPEAELALAALAPPGSTIGFAYDREQRDRYDRELMYLYTLDGLFINAALVEQGMAEAIRVGSNDQHWDQLLALEQRARSAGIGQWGSC